MNSGYGLGFTTQSNEMGREPLAVTGQMPSWLSGTLIRNGPAQFEVGSQRYRHWFDGLAMLHGFTFREDQVLYSNRFLRSGAFEDASRSGKVVRGEFATNPRRSSLDWLWSLFFPKPADNGCVSREPLMDPPVELPRINYRACNMKRHRFVYGVTRRGAATDFHDCLVKADLERGESAEWSDNGRFPGEPVFVAGPDAAAEDEGVILSVVLDAKQQKSFLLVLDGRSFQELARAQVPQHIPFGFHGQFYATVSR